MVIADLIQTITAHPLNRNQRWRALARVVRWQLGSRLAPGDIVYPWVNGSRFLVRPGETTLTGNIYTGLLDFQDMGFLLHVLRAEDLFVDIGANAGPYTILACAAVGARGWCFEPVPETHRRLLENIRLNHLEERVRCPNVAIGREAGVLKFTRDRDALNHVLARNEIAGAAIEVEVAPLDAVLGEESPTLLKLDVEGFETAVLDGADATLRKPSLHSAILELNGMGRRYGYEDSEIVKRMAGYDFRTCAYDPFERRLSCLEWSPTRAGNVLFVRDEAAVMEKIRTAPMVTVHGRQF